MIVMWQDVSGWWSFDFGWVVNETRKEAMVMRRKGY
jgi:hypothetical protein